MARHFKQESARPATSPRPTPRARRARRRGSARGVVALVLALAVVGVAVGGVVAWLTASSDLTNTFEIGTVDPVVNEDGSTPDTPFTEGDTVKQNVDVTNSGNIPIYVRAQVNIYWVDASGNQLWDAPVAGKDYKLTRTIPASNDWQQGTDGFYYWTSPLGPGATTSPLIEKIEQLTTNTYDDGRHLVCDIAAQGIQADPADAVEEAWHVTVGAESTLDITAEGE